MGAGKDIPDMSKPVTWREFLDDGLVWHQGEHVTMIGPTGAGKTTLAHDLLGRRGYVMVLGAKPQDRSLDVLIRDHGYLRISSWPPPPNRNRVIVWPPVRTRADLAKVGAEHRAAIDAAFTEGGWTIYQDELHLAVNRFKLAGELSDIWTVGRSSGITLVTSQQRPSHVPLLAYSQASHLVMWRTADLRDLLRLGGIGGYDTRRIAGIVRRLPRFHVLWVDTVRRTLTVVNAHRPSG